MHTSRVWRQSRSKGRSVSTGFGTCLERARLGPPCSIGMADRLRHPAFSGQRQIRQQTPIKPGQSIGKNIPLRKDFSFRLASNERALRLNFSWQLGLKASRLRPGLRDYGEARRLNTYRDSIERARVQPRMAEPQPAFQLRTQTVWSGPETLCSTPKRYPFKSKTAAHWGSSFLRTCGWGGVAKIPIGSLVMSVRPLASVPNQIGGVLPCPTQTGGAQAPGSWVCDWCGHRVCVGSS